jgi:CheY-like chemotaxis protein
MSFAGFPGIQNSVVLCIDDNEDLLECEKELLESFGCTVLAAASGGRGLELASQYLVDVVVLDYQMPEMNGQEVALEMRRLKPQIPIIMLSASPDLPHKVLKLVDAFVSKDHLASLLLPTIAQLRASVRTSGYDA